MDASTTVHSVALVVAAAAGLWATLYCESEHHQSNGGMPGQLMLGWLVGRGVHLGCRIVCGRLGHATACCSIWVMQQQRMQAYWQAITLCLPHSNVGGHAASVVGCTSSLCFACSCNSIICSVEMLQHLAATWPLQVLEHYCLLDKASLLPVAVGVVGWCVSCMAILAKLLCFTQAE